MPTTNRRGFMRIAAVAGFAGVTSVLVALAGCHGDSNSPAARQFDVAGTISGLDNGQSVVLEINGAAALTLTGNGAFAFTHAVAGNGSYHVTVAAQPTGQICTVSDASGAGIMGDVTNVAVTCSTDTYVIGGQVSGLAAGAQVVLENNGADALTVSSNGSFAFATPVAFDGSYNVTVSTPPADATCSVSMGGGAGVTADVSNVAVICSVNSFPIGGMLSGLAAGAQVTLEDNGADPLTLSTNGAFTFPAQVAAGGSYSVTVNPQPMGQTCTVSNGQGTDINNDISAVSVSCSVDTYTIGGTVSGLAAGAQITLDNNGADPLTVSTNGSFTFDTPVAYGGSYDVTVGTEPAGQGCIISAGTDTNVATNVTSVSVACVTTNFMTSGTYSFTVPDGVTSLQIVAVGGGGGGGGASGTFYAATAGGAGAAVSSTVAVTAGQVLTLVVGGGGGGGWNGPGSGGSYTCGTGGGGGGATTVDAGDADQIIAGGGGGGGSCESNVDGGNGGGTNGAGGSGGAGFPFFTAAAGGAGGSGGSGADDGMGDFGGSGGNGNGGPGGAGGDNGPNAGGSAGSGTGTGSGGIAQYNDDAGGGGGGYGGGGSGIQGSGGGAGGSTGPSGTTYSAASNAGAQAAAGGDGSIVITLQ